MDIIKPLIVTTISGLSTVLGVVVIFFKIKEDNYNKFISFCLSFSIAIMIGISILDIIPTSFFIIFKVYNIYKTIIILVIAFILSYIIITLLSFIIKRNVTSKDLYKLGVLNMIVLIIHGLPEGMATFLSSYQDMELGLKLSLAIMLHNIPEGISISVPIYFATNKKSSAIGATLISGLAEPLGALIAFLFFKEFVSDIMISIILLLVAGLMITLSIQEMLPKTLSYKENKSMYWGLIIGIVFMILNIVFC